MCIFPYFPSLFSLSPSVCLSIGLSVRLSVYLSARLSVYPSILPLPTAPLLNLSAYLFLFWCTQVAVWSLVSVGLMGESSHPKIMWPKQLSRNLFPRLFFVHFGVSACTFVLDLFTWSHVAEAGHF